MGLRSVEGRRTAWPVPATCEGPQVLTAGHGVWRPRPESRRAAENRALRDGVRQGRGASQGRCGSPRVHAARQARGRRAGRGRVERLVRRHGVRGLMAPPRRVRTTDSRHAFPAAPKLLDRRSTAAAPDQAWLADLTLYLIGVAGHSRNTRPGQPGSDLRLAACYVDGAPGLTHAPWTRSDGGQSPLGVSLYGQG